METTDPVSDGWHCPAEVTLDFLSGKWRPMVIYWLMPGPLRFNELQRRLGAITHRTLSRTLKEMEADNMVDRKDFREIPPRVEYSLTDFWARSRTGSEGDGALGHRQPGRGILSDTTIWPDIPYGPWQDTCSALHHYTQIIGKYRLAHTPWVNHSWHATFYIDADGLTTALVPDGPGITVHFDLRQQRLVASCANGQSAEFPLEPMSVATFDTQFKNMIAKLGGAPAYHGHPNELAHATPFKDDTTTRPWDADAVSRFHSALIRVETVFTRFRTSFIGKVSPVHLFWGSFDLAVTRFSGRAAPPHPGGIPNLPDAVTREAYSHEVSSAGFWPGGAGIEEACFYSYAYPTPVGFAEYAVKPAAARFDQGLGEFVLPYEAVRTAADPEAVLLEFLQSSFDAAAELGGWEAGLTRPVGLRGRPLPSFGESAA